MRILINTFTQFYLLLLWLYPAQFRTEYGEELRAVFYLRLQDAARRGRVALCARGLRELADLPVAAAREQLQTARRMENMVKKSSLTNIQPGSRHEAIVTSMPFLVFACMSLLSWLPVDLSLGVRGLVAMILLGGIAIAFLFGLFSGWPRWSLPMTGFVVAIALLPTAMLVAQATGGSITNLFLGIGGVSVLVLVIVFAVRRLDLRRFFSDWTLVSFIGYGGTLLLLNSSFEGYHGEGLVQCLATLALAGGAWIFIRTKSRVIGVAALATAASTATLVIALGKVWLINHGMVADWLQGSWLMEVLSTLALGFVALAAILGPALLNWLPIDRIRGIG